MKKDKITFSISKKTLLIILIILVIFFLPIPSYQTLPRPCLLLYRMDGQDPCPPAKKGWVLTRPVFFRIIDFLKDNLLPRSPTGFIEPGEGTSEGGTFDSVNPQ